MQRKDSGIMTGRTRQEQVQRMHRNGYTALEIAGQLNIPLPEVIAVIGSLVYGGNQAGSIRYRL